MHILSLLLEGHTLAALHRVIEVLPLLLEIDCIYLDSRCCGLCRILLLTRLCFLNSTDSVLLLLSFAEAIKCCPAVHRCSTRHFPAEMVLPSNTDAGFMFSVEAVEAVEALIC